MKINNTTPLINNVQTNHTQKTAFKGLERFKPTKLFSLDRQGPMNTDLFIISAFVFLLGSRLFNSRDGKNGDKANEKISFWKKIKNFFKQITKFICDKSLTLRQKIKRFFDFFREKNEIRETIVRDVPTIIIAVSGVPFIAKKSAKFIQNKTGFAICENIKNGAAKYSQIEDWYKYDENIALGFKGFSERLKNLGGNLKEIYSSLDSNMKEQLKGLSDNNDEFIKQLNQKRDLLKILETEMAKSGNKVLQQALFLKNATEFIGFGLTFILLGLCIPKLNIFITESLHKNKKEEAQKTDTPNPAEVKKAA